MLSQVFSEMAALTIKQKLEIVSQNLIFPVLASGLVAYTNQKNHPFEVQFVSGWIATTVFQESRVSPLTSLLSAGLASMYINTFQNEVRRLDITYFLNPNLKITWMHCLNVSGSFYLAASWIFMILVSCDPRIQRYRKPVNTSIGVSYVILALALCKKYRR